MLTALQMRWVSSRGGRTIADVLEDEKGDRYVMMWSGPNKEEVRVYIPDEKVLEEMFRPKRKIKGRLVRNCSPLAKTNRKLK